MADPHYDLRAKATILFAFISSLWIVGIVNAIAFHGRLLAFGIVPRTERGLWGIPFSPFLHEGIAHLLANTGGILIFGGLVMLRDKRHFWVVTLIGGFVSGAGTWLLARSATHVGASGIIFAYLGYLLFAGVFERRFWSLLLSCLVFAIWWPTLYGLSPLQRGVSWEAHAFGLLGGALSSWLLALYKRAND